MKPDRRTFLKGSAGGVMACCIPTSLPLFAATTERRHLIGHTGITWGYSPEVAPRAIADTGTLGYHGFESFGSILEYWETRGGLQEQLSEAGLPLVGAYCPLILTDAGKRDEEVAKVVRWGTLIKKYGGSIAVIGPDNVDRSTFDFAASRNIIITTLNAMGEALQDIGITPALHQHTGSCVTTRDETYAVMEAVNSDLMKLCPDTGELLAAGADPVQVISDFLPVVAHVHIKDYNGGGAHDGYTAVGQGQVDVAGVLEALETSDADFMIMAELNPDNAANSQNPGTPLARATTSKNSFSSLGYNFR